MEDVEEVVDGAVAVGQAVKKTVVEAEDGDDTEPSAVVILKTCCLWRGAPHPVNVVLRIVSICPL